MELLQGLASHLQGFLSAMQSIETMAHYIKEVQLNPVFMLAHYTLIALVLREGYVGSHAFAKVHPLGSWVVCLISSLAGTIILNFLLGISVLEPFKKEEQLVYITVVWYLVFFSPFDVVSYILQHKVFRAVLLTMKEFHRVRMVMQGISIGLKYHPDCVFITIVLGSIKGSGAKFLLPPLNHFVRGEVISSNEIQRLHFSTKASIVISTVLTLIHTRKVACITEDVTLVAFVTGMILFQLSFLFLRIRDPFVKLEEWFCCIVLDLPQNLGKKTVKQKDD